MPDGVDLRGNLRAGVVSREPGAPFYVSDSTGKQSTMNPVPLTERRRTHRVLRCAAFVLSAALALRGQTTGSAATPLMTPTSIAFDANGVLYVAESGRHVIDRLDTSGVFTVVAGNGTQGYAGDGGAAAAASLDSPRGLTVDGAGNLYIADTRNHRVRMVAASTGTIRTIAGTGAPGYSGDGGAATSARLCLPTALAVDGVGSLYIADSGNQRIRRVTLASGVISTVAGSGVQGGAGDQGPATAAALDTPWGLAANAAGDLYLADLHNGRVRRVAHDTGVITSMAAGTGLRLPRGSQWMLPGPCTWQRRVATGSCGWGQMDLRAWWRGPGRRALRETEDRRPRRCSMVRRRRDCRLPGW